MTYFYYYSRREPGEATVGYEPFPCSFWIDNLEWDEDSFELLATTLNFYMHYFDRGTPIIRVHAEEYRGTYRERRYPFDRFPNRIEALDLPQDLLTIWTGTLEVDTFKRFLYSFQILEHAAFYFVNDDLDREIRRIISRPHAGINLDATVAAILEKLAPERNKTSDEDKIRAIFERRVDPEILWNELSVAPELFIEPTEFEGGFAIQGILQPKDDLATFKSHWHPTICNRFITIRNALVHSRESRTNTTISPTAKNYALLLPWSILIDSAAQQVIVHK